MREERLATVNKAKQFIYDFAHKDLFETLKSGYSKIPEIDKKVFFIIFAVLNLVFIFHTMNFLWGDHDWGNIKRGLEWDYFFYESRYSATSLKTLLTFGQILPVLNNVIAFFFFSLGTVLLLNYWEAPKSTIQRILIGLTITIAPFVNLWLWFARHTVENLSIPLFVVLGLMLSSKNFWKNLLAIVCFLFSLGIYPSALITILTIWGIKIVIDLISNNFELKQTLFKNLNSFINIFVSLFSYKVILIVMKLLKLSKNFYKNDEHLPLNEIITNIPHGIEASFQQLVNYHAYFMPHILTTLFFIIFVLVVLFGLTKLFNEKVSRPEKVKRFLICAGLFFLILLGTKFAAILSGEDIYLEPRIDFYGLMFLRGFFVLLIFKYGNILLKNITYILVLLILWISMVCNFFYQKVFYLSLNAEILRLNRIVYDIEHHPQYIPNKKYRIIRIGIPEIIMKYFIPEKFRINPKRNKDLIPKNMYKQKEFIQALSLYAAHKFGTEQNEYQELTNIINELEPYPSEKYIYIKDDLMVLTFSDEKLNEIKEELSE